MTTSRTHVLRPRLPLIRGLLLGLMAATMAQAASQDPFDQPPTVQLQSWKGKATHGEGAVTIRAPDGRGLVRFDRVLDLSTVPGIVPVLRLRSLPGNAAKRITLSFVDREGRSLTVPYQLPAPGGFAEVSPLDGTQLTDPAERDRKPLEEGVDLANISVLILKGDWSSDAVAVALDALTFVPADATHEAKRRQAAERRAATERQKQQQESARLQRVSELLESGAAHPADGPDLREVTMVAPHIVCLTIQEGEPHIPGLAPYVPQPGDEIERKPLTAKEGETVPHVWVDGRLVPDEQRLVKRQVPGGKRMERIGMLSRDGQLFLADESIRGAELETALIDDPRAYRITSAVDARFAQGAQPQKVHRASKPNGRLAGNRQPRLHRIYLEFAAPLQTGGVYEIALYGLNTRQATATLTYDSRRLTSPAVHAIHTGYRPEDPGKVASLSLWLGTGGGFKHQPTTFEVLDDATGSVAFSGTARLAKDLGASEAFREGKDYARTAVWSLDFSSLKKPGTYRVHVPGIGCSRSFRIADETWRDAFVLSMRGFVNQRSGIALDRSFADLDRPRPWHPEDGVRFVQLGITRHEGQEGDRGRNLVALQAAGQLTEVQGIWGGYQDAGDWDSLGSHLNATYLLLDLADLHPAFVSATKLSLPPAEAANSIPDTLDEALWNLANFRRLQLADGGVRGGYGEGWGGERAETSWMQKLAGVYAPDLETSLMYAACAAKAARLLAAHAPEDAKAYAASAVRAWTWAGNQPAPTDAKLVKAVGRVRPLAAAELLWMTRDPAYHAAFLAASELRSMAADAVPEQPEASFVYARLPRDLADAAIQKRAVALFAAAGERAVRFLEGNGYGVVTDTPDLPVISYAGFFTVPGANSQNLPRAHALTGDPRFLAATVRACGYVLGANPENRTSVTGLGHDWPRNVLHLDSRRTAQAPARGITIYGAGDETSAMSRKWNSWVGQWYATGITPAWDQWPAQQSHLDIYTSPSLCEYTIQQCLAPMSYHLGYLAARTAQ